MKAGSTAGPGSKAQLKEMLAILNSGPKRPSFLDKPPVTGTAGKKAANGAAESSSPEPDQATSSLVQSAMLSGKEAGDILGLIEFEPDDHAHG